METNDLNVPIATRIAPKCADGTPIDQRSSHTGRPRGTSNIHAKQASSIARRFKLAGLDWVADLAIAIKTNKRERIKLWMRLLPYLVTTSNKMRVKKSKGRASKAAIAALNDLEGR